MAQVEKEVITRIGDYDVTVHPPLATGTFGNVYKAEHCKNKRKVVAKVMSFMDENGHINDERRTMAATELRVILEITSHKNIVTLFEILSARHSSYLFMEYCDQGDLKNYLIKNVSLLVFLKKVDIMHQIASAVAYMHSHNVIHRDLKLDNILMKTENGNDVIKVADFGLSKLLHPSTSAMFRPGPYMGTTCGDPCYMAPEFYAECSEGVLYTASVDVYAMGLVFTVLLQYGCGHNELYPISLEARRNKKFVSIGRETVMCYRDKKKLPTVVKIERSDSASTKRLKRMIQNMTRYRMDERKPVTEVEEELSELMEQEVENENQRQTEEGHLREIATLQQALSEQKAENQRLCKAAQENEEQISALKKEQASEIQRWKELTEDKSKQISSLAEALNDQKTQNDRLQKVSEENLDEAGSLRKGLIVNQQQTYGANTWFRNAFVLLFAPLLWLLGSIAGELLALKSKVNVPIALRRNPCEGNGGQVPVVKPSSDTVAVSKEETCVSVKKKRSSIEKRTNESNIPNPNITQQTAYLDVGKDVTRIHADITIADPLESSKANLGARPKHSYKDRLTSEEDIAMRKKLTSTLHRRTTGRLLSLKPVKKQTNNKSSDVEAIINIMEQKLINTSNTKETTGPFGML